MKSPQRAKLQKRLVALSRELAGKAPRRLSPNRTSEVESGGDEDEQPLNEMLQAIASNRNRTDATLSARVERALEKLSETPAEYGLCEDCGDDIPLARLEAMPYAELCVACQGQRDGPRDRPTRRKVTDYRD